jgi:hypothetical protein
VSSTDAVFNPEAGYEPLRLSAHFHFLLRRGGAVLSPKSEEREATPGGAGDGAGDG